MNVRTWPIAGIVFAVLWVFVRGIELSPAAIVGQFLAGLVVGLPVAFVFRRLYVKRVDLRQTVHGLPFVGLYFLAFTYEVVRANVDVAYRVLAPGTQIDPEVIAIPLRVETDLAITTLANSITITPGTVTLDHEPDANELYVHVIDGTDLESTVEPIHRWEDYALEIFDERLSPDDPPGEIRSTGEETDD
ncbi:Na+/H+ antiporter subunit E [Natribaculum luteum]|uniref:Na+/H+ antiporter subunit E n=1 Tax=Natribaculum luteum TaxID=1586232 RepID=A0ABD5NUE5_9EURY|nr:Na+/H+ antiporter subunit E [Natribaculum luteum]